MGVQGGWEELNNNMDYFPPVIAYCSLSHKLQLKPPCICILGIDYNSKRFKVHLLLS